MPQGVKSYSWHLARGEKKHTRGSSPGCAGIKSAEFLPARQAACPFVRSALTATQSNIAVPTKGSITA